MFSFFRGKRKKADGPMQEVSEELPSVSAVKPAAKKVAKSSAEPKLLPPRDPYAAAKAEFNEIWGGFVTREQNWRLVALLLAIGAVVEGGFLGKAATQSKFVPYVVEVDPKGQPTAVSLANNATTASDERLVRAFLTRFVVDLRGVSVDPQVEKQAVNRVFSMVATQTVGEARVRQFVMENNPLRRGQEETVAVEVKPLLQLSKDTWQASWRETTRDLTGRLLSTKDFRGSFTVAFNPPTDEQQVMQNPLGLFVIDTDWRQELGQ